MWLNHLIPVNRANNKLVKPPGKQFITGYFANYSSWSEKAQDYVLNVLETCDFHGGAEHHKTGRGYKTALKVWKKAKYKIVARPASESGKTVQAQ